MDVLGLIILDVLVSTFPSSYSAWSSNGGCVLSKMPSKSHLSSACERVWSF
jgi:hypothetical protein